jgi:hypothetical protein
MISSWSRISLTDRLLYGGLAGITLLSLWGGYQSISSQKEEHIANQTQFCRRVQSDQLQTMSRMVELWKQYSVTALNLYDDPGFNKILTEWDLLSLAIVAEDPSGAYFLAGHWKGNIAEGSESKPFDSPKDHFRFINENLRSIQGDTPYLFGSGDGTFHFFYPLPTNDRTQNPVVGIQFSEDILIQRLGSSEVCPVIVWAANGEPLAGFTASKKWLKALDFNKLQNSRGVEKIKGETNDHLFIYDRHDSGLFLTNEIPLAEFWIKHNHDIRRAISKWAYLLLLWSVLVLLFHRSFNSPIERFIESLVEMKRGNYKSLPRLFMKGILGKLENAIVELNTQLETKFSKIGLPASDIDLRENKSTLQKVIVLEVSPLEPLSFYDSRSIKQSVHDITNFFETITRSIENNGGRVFSIDGDLVKAYWIISENPSETAAAAGMSTIEIRKSLILINKERLQSKLPPLTLTIGMAQDKALCSNLGPSNREIFQVYGPAGFHAGKLRTFAAQTGEDILLDESLAKQSETFLISELAGHLDGQKVYRLTGYIDVNHKPVEIRSPYSRFPARTSG